jgi:hypothetical protein
MKVSNAADQFQAFGNGEIGRMVDSFKEVDPPLAKDIVYQ